MKKNIVCFLFIAVLAACNAPASEAPVEPAKPAIVEGTWKLVSGTMITGKDTVVTDYTKGQEMIKIINASHFAFLKHGLKGTADSATYDSGGGSYELAENQYTEHLQYCTEREWEGHDFKFTVSVSNDTLVQTGLEKLENLGIDRIIIERYAKIKN